ncbi:hypothetical protein ACIBSV_01285 [Embleya sp. NPDC050154]|uniref:hypothetical protein n=1 Tax=Embleya sp. NPDC050154 TaxID=3363988 RepID=UPI00378ACC1D
MVPDHVGGPLPTALVGRLAPGGRVIAIGAVSGERADFSSHDPIGPQTSVIGFQRGGDSAADPAYVVHLVADGLLHAPVDWQADWTRVGEATALPLGRRVRGKAVLT